jgi:hypothetical protein
MRESYKRFVKRGFVLRIHGFVPYRDHESWIRFVSWVTNPAIFKRFVLRIRFVTQFSKDLTNPTNPHESSRILSTIDLRIHTNPVLPDSRIPTVYKRFVSWIRFVDSFLKDLFCGFVSWKFFFQITRFVSFRKDSYTNPAPLKNITKTCLVSAKTIKRLINIKIEREDFETFYCCKIRNFLPEFELILLLGKISIRILFKICIYGSSSWKNGFSLRRRDNGSSSSSLRLASSLRLTSDGGSGSESDDKSMTTTDLT